MYFRGETLESVGKRVSPSAPQRRMPILISGDSPPEQSTGVTGDVYLLTSAMAIYPPKTESGWGEASPLKDSGGFAEDGVGISKIKQSGSQIEIILTNGDVSKFNLPQPERGGDGRGISSISSQGSTINVNFSDGTTESLEMPVGRDGRDGVNGINGVNGIDGESARDIEIRSSETHFQWRREGDLEWLDFYEIPKQRRIMGGGGGRTTASIRVIAREEIAASASGQKIERATTSQAITTSAYQWNGSTDAGDITFTLPAGVQDAAFRLVNTGTSGNTLTITPNGSELLVGSDGFTLQDGETLIIGYDSNDGWF